MFVTFPARATKARLACTGLLPGFMSRFKFNVAGLVHGKFGARPLPFWEAERTRRYSELDRDYGV
eukprot:3594930-Rhodomonas_salina.1